MTIEEFRLYPLPFAFLSGGFSSSYGRRTHLNNLLLVLVTDGGLVGLGEICRKPGNSPEPTSTKFTGHCRKALQNIIGSDSLDLQSVRSKLGDLDESFSNLTSAVETACFDLLARAAERPLWDVLGGKRQDSVPVYHTIGQAPPGQMATEALQAQQQSCRVLQVKVGGGDSVVDDMACIQALLASLHDDTVMLVDANGGWDVDTALSVMARFGDERIYWEEPCKTYAENKRVASAGAPVILDQCVTGPDIVQQACDNGVVRGVSIKCTVQGGLQAGLRSRNLAIEHGLMLKVDDSWSADVACVASLHLAMAVPPEQLLASIDMRPFFDRRISAQGPLCDAYRLTPDSLPGLGLVADLESLGPPLK